MELLEPKLNAFITVTEREALEQADAADKRIAANDAPPLCGIPLGIKDIYATRGVKTTCASKILENFVPPFDATVIAKLRGEGAVFVGKANMDEFAMGSSTENSAFGPTRNPHDLERVAGGSSGGSAAAVAACECLASLGTDTGGSIREPASFCGVVGIKPTLGLVSRSGVIPVAHSQDTVGPMCRTVTDAAILLGGMVGIDRDDPSTQSSKGRFHTDYTKFLDQDGLKGARIGVPRDGYFGYSAGADAIAETAIERMRRLGAVIVDPADIPTAKQMSSSEDEMTVLLYEFKADLNSYLSRLEKSRVRSLKEVIEFNEKHKGSEMKYFGQDLFNRAQKTRSLKDRKYLKALRNNQLRARQQGLDLVMDKHRLDALVAPSGAPPWTVDLVDGDHGLGGSSQPTALAGYPAVTVPAGYVFGLPVGITFMGRAFSEPTLIRLAYAFERATRHRVPPRYRRTTALG
jgi:amidase